MSKLDQLKAILGPEFVQLILDSHREAVEDGVRMGMGIAARSLDATAERMTEMGVGEIQTGPLKGCAAAIRQASAEFRMVGDL